MRYLLDISTLLAAIWQTHSAHEKVDAWLKGKLLVVCPFSELGFLRISTNLRGPFKATMSDGTVFNNWQKLRCLVGRCHHAG